MASRSSSAEKVVPTEHASAPKPKRKARRKRSAPASEAAPAAERSFRVGQEILAVLLCCFGLLTLLALASYEPADASLNSAGSSAVVRNWIGPAGAYWSDLLLQALGVGAYALSLGALLAGWRSLIGRRVLPGLRETLGTVLLIACSGALAELVLEPGSSYPAGGVGGAVLAAVLQENFATLGAAIIATGLVLISVAITADGILRGLGMRGLSVARDGLSRVRARWTLIVEQRNQLREHRRNQRAVEPSAPRLAWSWDEDQERAREEERQRRVDEAKAQAEANAKARAEREAAKAAQSIRRPEAGARRERSLPGVVLDQTVDMPAEEHFELGKLTFDADEPAADEPRFDDTDGEMRPVSIRAASSALESRSGPERAERVPSEVGEPEQVSELDCDCDWAHGQHGFGEL
ncbi:MAG: DNA translocase FtsK 4TM domain-containing protein [Myxococcota bacterium]